MPERPGAPITVALIDDHALFRDGVRRILSHDPDLVVAGEASDSESAFVLVGATKPDVVLLDVQVDFRHVLETVRRLRALSPRTHIIILTMHDDAVLLGQLLDLGVRGYMLKNVRWHELTSAVRSVALDPARVILAVSPQTVAPAAAPPGRAVLSARELEILELTARAFSNAQIANRLSLTEATVKRHLRNVFAKLGAVSRLDAVNKARAAALISAEVA